MKYLFSIVALCLFSFNIGFAQNYSAGTITTNTNETIEGKVSIDNNAKKVFFKKSGDSKIYNFDSVKEINLNGEVFSKINFKSKEYLANHLVSGKSSLYTISDDEFIIINDNNEQYFNLTDDKQQIPGILSLLFNDCNVIRDEINKTEEYSEKSLIKISESYNNCEYGNYVPTENEMTKANSFNTDSFRFYGALVTSFNNTNVNNQGSNNSNGFGVGIGLASSPSFMGKLQGNIYIDFDFSMIFSGDQAFKNGVVPLNYKVNSFRLSIGLEYVFNKEGLISPFLGVGYGYTSDYYNGTLDTINFNDHAQNFFFVPKAGVLYKLKNEKHLGLTVSYISDYENNLSFIYNENYNPLVIKNSFVTLGLSYYF